ncbi:membrane protein insertion efficiency factor YidD [Bombiscardovia coagulans]|uniref:Putative membrane protein insertion efficiency factor n=1 Tax=Bombiscardovia coagulans TaxID=686666 RepID=A0A261EQP6_9BIFI|nr:membrane protein insertion efficiency factor YidD [Bombiscardovia coagulans]OZG49172.1 alpha-hemolysin-like protein [Bombiscardovia coagulans]
MSGAAQTGTPTLRECKSTVSRACIRCLRWYQGHISPLSPPSCRYYPSCSQYAVNAVERFGAVRGTALALLRLLRCRPWSPGGIDDVPTQFSLCYRFRWSKAHEEPRLHPLPMKDMSEEVQS